VARTEGTKVLHTEFIVITVIVISECRKSVPGKVATTHTEDGHKQNTKTSVTM
jgi:hypothetical protein